MRLFLPSLALLGAFYAFPLSATAIVPFAHLSEATTYSEYVVLGCAIIPSATEVNGTTYQDMRFESLEVAKGALAPGTQFLLRPLSEQKAPYRIDITGDSQPKTGKPYLLFLCAKKDFWRPMVLSYYVFKQIKSDDDAFLVPVGGAGMEAVQRYSFSSTHSFDGMDWENALYGFVVANNGTPSCLSSANFEIMMTRQLARVNRMGHLSSSNFPNQIMNPICCNTINTKDWDCMNYAHPSPAPVTLISFEAEVKNEQTVLLRWATAMEKDNAYFSVLRSKNGTQYTDIQRINGQKNPQGGQYQWEDKNPLKGQNYYLLSQTDLDGKSQHLSIRAVTVGANTASLQIQPHPVTGNALTFSIILPRDFEGVLEVVAMDGLTAISQLISLEKGLQSVQQPLGDLPKGIYLLHLYDGQQQWSARFLKN